MHFEIQAMGPGENTALGSRLMYKIFKLTLIILLRQFKEGRYVTTNSYILYMLYVTCYIIYITLSYIYDILYYIHIYIYIYIYIYICI